MKLVVTLTVLAALSMSDLAHAEIYRWVDDGGTVHFTEDPLRVPAPERETAQLATAEVAELGGVSFPGSRSTTSASSEVPFEEEGQLMKVMVRLNGRVEVPFYLDTGSTELVVPAAVAEMLGGEAVYTGQVTLNTPSGRVRVPTLQLDSVQIGGVQVSDLRASVSPSLEVGLLGGSFLNQFRYSIDPVTQTLTLEPRADRVTH